MVDVAVGVAVGVAVAVAVDVDVAVAVDVVVAVAGILGERKRGLPVVALGGAKIK